MLFGSKKQVVTDEARIEEVLSRGVHEIITSKDSLKKLLMSGAQLRIKLGIDPTSPNIHLGRGVPLLKLKDFQDLGHKVVFIVGDFTAQIGDTSDKDAERPMLSQAQVEENLKSYKEQVAKILDISQAEFRRNSEWLSSLTYREIGEQADAFSVADFIGRDNIKKRLTEGKRVSLREVLYPIMQGYDSVAIKADVEIGGTDQRFNILAGRVLQEKAGQKPQHCVFLPLMVDANGNKMSSSVGNTINIQDSPNEMFGKAMSIPDELVEQYFIGMTRVPLELVETYKTKHPKEVKMALAKEFVRMYHSEKEAEKAQAEFEKTFSGGGVPDEVDECVMQEGQSLIEALVACGVVVSKTEGRRLLEAGAIKITGTDEKITETNPPLKEGDVLRVGKHRFVKIVSK